MQAQAGDEAATSSGDYAKRLSRGQFRGTLNLPAELDAPLLIERKTKLLAEQIKQAKHVVLHTGAGISVASGINDFRGPNGIWTTEAKKNNNKNKNKVPRKRPRPASFHADSDDEELHNIEGDTFQYADTDHLKGAIDWDEAPERKATSIENAAPSLTHMVIAEMVRLDLVQLVISQNVDNLHLRSGVPREKLSEIHGNLFVEWCATCEVEYVRDFEIQTAGLQATGRKCARCGGALTDKQLDWEDQLPVKDEQRAEEARVLGDLHIVVGSSCQMTPSREYPFKSGRKHTSCIINLSRTDKDSAAGNVIRARCDTVFALLANYLGIKIPVWNHTSEIRLCARPRKNPDDESRTLLVIGIHTANGEDDGGFSVKIPWVKSVAYYLNETFYKKAKKTSFVVPENDVSHVRVKVQLAYDDDDRKYMIDIGMAYEGKQAVSRAESTIIRSVASYKEMAEAEIQLIRNKGKEALVHWNHLKRDLKAWIVHNKKGRYVDCIFCGKELYVGGGNWQRAARKHISMCLEAAVGPNPAAA